MRIISIDPGKKRIGVALSDPTGTIASPLTILPHKVRSEDAEKIVKLADEHNAELIVIGQSFTLEGIPSLEGRGSARLAGAIKNISDIPIVFWDEGESTLRAREKNNQPFKAKKNSAHHIDDEAAAIILQSYIDYQESVDIQ